MSETEDEGYNWKGAVQSGGSSRVPVDGGVSVGPVERDVIEAAVEAADRAAHAAFIAALVASDIVREPKQYDELSDRIRRIRANQIRGTVEAAYAVIAAAVQAEVRQRALSEAADEVHREAAWQEEQFMRQTPIKQNARLEMRDRLLLVEQVIRSRATDSAAPPAAPTGEAQ